MRSASQGLLVLVVLASFAPRLLRAEEAPESREQTARQERLEYLQRLFAEFELTDEQDNPLSQTGDPVLRYSNPIRNFFSDGATFLWLDGDRAVAAGTVSVRGTGHVWAEFSSFSERPLRCVRSGRAVWTPESGNLVREPLAGAAEPASSPKLRLLQMRQLARRFSVTMSESEQQRDEISTLRLLPNPVYVWADEQSGSEGAVFSFSETTDPEAFLILEPVTDVAQPAWRYSLARMTSRPLVFQFDGREVLSLSGYWTNPRSPADAYAAQRLGNYEPAGSRPE